MEQVPSDKPIVLIPNHVNGFIDPIIIGMLLKRKIRFFARGDVFKGALAKWVLNDMNVSPMYRMTEGYSDVKKNDKTFEECRRLLSENKIILMFPEGICIQERRIKRFKKGLARIILSVEEADSRGSDILVVPVGLNYSSPKNFRSSIFLNFGQPIHIRDFQKQYEADKVKAINECTQFMEGELHKVVITVNDSGNDALYEALTEIHTAQGIEEEGLSKRNLEEVYVRNRKLAFLINALQETKPDQIQHLRERIVPYMEEVRNLRLRDHLLRKDLLAKMNLKTILNDFLVMWFGLPLYWIGLLLNLPPYRVARNLARDKAKHVEFYASVYANAGMFLWIIYYLLQLFLIHSLSHQWVLTLIWAGLTPLTGLFVLRFYPVMKKVFGRWRLLGLVKKNRDQAERLILEREAIVQLIKHTIHEFE